MEHQQIPSPLERINEANCRVWVVDGDIITNGFEIDQSLWEQAIFHSSAPLASAILAYLARKRSIIGGPSSAGPLSIPSCTSLRSSSTV